MDTIEAFQRLKTNLEPSETFAALITQKHNAVRSLIENNGQQIRTQLIGSLQRRTRIQPRDGDSFDIDILVELGGFNQWAAVGGVTPQAALGYLHSLIGQSDRYGAMAPQVDHPTVSFEYADGIEVQLVAAYRDNVGHSPAGITHAPPGRGYWVPKNGTWELSDYDHEAEYISGQNDLTGGLLIPTIKMLKAIKRDHFPDMSSFHLEILAAHIIPPIVLSWKQKGWSTEYQFLLTHFFNSAGLYLTNPVKIPGSNSAPVYLDQTPRLATARAIQQIKNHCNKIILLGNETQKVIGWKELFGDKMPLS